MGVTSTHPARYGRTLPDGRVRCELCPRRCTLAEGQRGFCFVRANIGGQLVLTTYGRSTGFGVDPIEKKPLYHFHPGSSVLSFGTAGCNLACRCCQNWELSRSRAVDAQVVEATPEAIAQIAVRTGCASVAYTYNEPLIWAEYAIDVAAACRERGVLNVAVTAGYAEAGPRRDFFAAMDAANVDLKGFDAGFYRRHTGGDLRTVLDTLVDLRGTGVWVEITTLVIPGGNDSTAELTALSRWVATELGPDVPLHFSAFHPDHRMPDVPRTPLATLARARAIGQDAGLHYVYLGNVRDAAGSRTECPCCGATLIERDGLAVVRSRLDADARCPDCQVPIAGRFGTDRAGATGR